MTKFVTRLLLSLAVIVGAVYCEAQTVSPILQPHQTFVDSAGAPCAGCQLFTYAAGTSTPQATYTDSTGGTPNPNPITLDAAGGAVIWLSATSYKFVLKDALGNTIWTADNVNGLGAPYIPPTNGTAFGSVSKGWDVFARNLTVSGTFSPSVISGNPSFPGNVSVGGSLTAGSFSATGTSALGAATAKKLNAIRYADQFSGVDACAKINAAVLDDTIGAVVDATNFSGNQACASNPLASAASSGGQVVLGQGATYQTTATWNVPQNWRVVGGGIVNGSTIQAASSAANPVVTLSVGVSASEGTTIRDTVIDCNNQTSLIGLQNQNAQEMSDVRRVSVLSCQSIGIDLETSASQNMGIYDSQVRWDVAGSASAGSIGVKVNTSGPSRGIHGLTVNATGQATAPNVGILINSQGIYENIHCEGVVTCISVTSGDVIVRNIHCGPGVTNCVSLGSGVQNVLVEAVTNSANNILVDSTNSNTLTVASDPGGVGWYVTGSSGATPGACSSSVNVTCKVIPSMTLSGALGVTGLTTATGGIKAGASGSTISDTRELVQSAHACGTSTACSNTANGANRIIYGSVALSSGTPSTATITGISPAYASTSSYFCTVTNATTQANPLKVANVSGSSFTITGPNTVTDTVNYSCIGN